VSNLTKLKEQLESELSEKSETIASFTTERNEQAEKIVVLTEKV
jgi:hypothetical protein